MEHFEILRLDNDNSYTLERVHHLMKQGWWSKDRSLERIQRVIKGSTSCFGLFSREGEMLGFARVLSDGIEKAMIYDVLIDQLHHGKGLGTLLLDFILASPDCKEVNHVELYCKMDMFPFYAKTGFVPLSDPVHLLRRTL